MAKVNNRGSRSISKRRFVFPNIARQLDNVDRTFRPNLNGRVAFRGVDDGYPDAFVATINTTQEAVVRAVFNEGGQHPNDNTKIILYYGVHPSSHGNYMP